MRGWGYVGDCLCPFCRSGMESRDHLFFECSFSGMESRDHFGQGGGLATPLFFFNFFFLKKKNSEEMIIAKIKWEIRARIMAKGPYKKTSMNV